MNKIIVIVGPTAVGKTKLSIELAKKYEGEVVNADSTQVYKKMNVATAKVTEEEAEGIIHHLLDIKDIDEDYTVYDYQKDARIVIDDILKRGKTPIVVGGTGLYIKALLYDYDFKKEEKKYDFSSYSDDELYSELKKVDPNTIVHKNNRKRVERHLSYYMNYNKPMSSKEKTDKLLYDCIFIGLTTDRDKLYERINKRVDVMMNNGLLKEAKDIYDINIRSKAVMTPIGYKELFPYFDGKLSLEQSLDDIKKNSRHYAKKQYTWFNNQMDIKWFDTDFNNFDNTVNAVVSFIDNSNK